MDVWNVRSGKTSGCVFKCGSNVEECVMWNRNVGMKECLQQEEKWNARSGIARRDIKVENTSVEVRWNVECKGRGEV